MTRSLLTARRLREARWRVLQPVRRARHAVASAVFGVPGADTEGYVMLEELGLEAPGRVHYQPSSDTWLWRGMRGLPVTSDDVFLDYGAGKGKVVLQAALRYPFGKVIGVELSEDLAHIARANVERLAPRLRTTDVEIIVADAAEWPLADDVTYVYMYRPVKGPVFGTVLSRIDESLRRAPRKLTLIYAYPEQETELIHRGFKRIRESRGPSRVINYTVSVYVRDEPTAQDRSLA